MQIPIQNARGEFRRQFGREATWLVAAPGRVNLIGEHVDYNDGLVLPMAIDRYTVIAAGPASSNAQLATVYSCALQDSAQLRLDSQVAPGPVAWHSYVQGVIAQFARKCALPSFGAVVASTVPVGSGLSSSAALTVATATLLEQITGISLNSVEKGLLCQEAEHEFAKVPCGIMDPFSSIFGEAGKLVLLDCRTQNVTPVEMSDPDVVVLIANSNVQHELASGEYARRRAECDELKRRLGKASLRDVSLADLNAAGAVLDATLYRRGRHVVSEIGRVSEAAKALKSGQLSRVGELMYDSHCSMRDDYDISCDEIDALVEIAKGIGQDGGVIGSRMTGGGFGGCTVSLVRRDKSADISERIASQYADRTGKQATVFCTEPSRGAHRVEV